jgi:hypothetical protein
MSKKESGISLGAMRAMGAALERLGLANKMGLSFNGARDIYDVFGYKKNLDWQDFWLKYLRQDIAKRVIDYPADSTWVQGAQLTLKKSSRSGQCSRRPINLLVWVSIR